MCQIWSSSSLRMQDFVSKIDLPESLEFVWYLTCILIMGCLGHHNGLLWVTMVCYSPTTMVHYNPTSLVYYDPIALVHYDSTAMVLPLWSDFYGPSTMDPIRWCHSCGPTTIVLLLWSAMIPVLWSAMV